MPRFVPIDQQRTIQLIVKVTPSEKIEITQAAGAALLPMSTFVRAEILSFLRKEAKASHHEMEAA